MESLKERMAKSIDSFKQQLVGLRTGRANPDMLNTIQVDYYGSMVPLKQVASISVPEARTLLLNVFDRNAVKNVERAIIASNLGLNPNTDDNLIRIQLPELTEDRRKELVKHIGKVSEETKVAVRNIRRDKIDQIKAEEKQGDATEDDSKRLQQDTQKITDDFISKIETLFKEKETELLTI
ncbi:ribosome recycling factor [Candidatus Marinamargulisbacteria bacterium SCGC AAA071-K20]|nr:ribosome recycling factor [Candidatus Marinamargulisbacteria bacterium SCGC AAA071-K20]